MQDIATETAWQFSQEFRLASDFGGPFNFSAGGNYLHYETNEKYYVFSNAFTLLSNTGFYCYDTNAVGPHGNLACQANGKGNLHNPLVSDLPTETSIYIDPNGLTNPNDNGHNYFLSKNPYVLNSYALFGEAYYSVTNSLKLTGGLRWTDDQKHFPLFPSRVITTGYGIIRYGQIDQSWKKFSGRAVINWTPKLDFTDQTMVYASYSHGYKAGGANPPPAGFIVLDGEDAGTPVHPLTFNPEYIQAYELGTKNTALDGALVFDADVFYYDYTGYQISQIVDRTSVNINVNATVQGAEIQTTWEPLQGLKFGFNGGYEDTRIKNNQYFIDLTDRTAGTPGWIVMKPFPTLASNCIVPEYVAAALVQNYPDGFQGNPSTFACGYAYPYGGTGIDPVTGLNYDTETSNGTTAPVGHGTLAPFENAPAGYPGYDPLSVDPNLGPSALAAVNNGLGLPPNFGEGFAKNVGGNTLPNAPHFTVSLTGDYTMPVSANWAATLHSDFYWQSQSWARIFNDRPYDKIRGYANVNLALILTDATGWQVMGYVKNVFDTTAITGDFLNSDDTGLTTNIFVTDPRLYGIRITKQFTGGSPGDGGFDLFSDADDKRPQLWLTLGGNFNAHLDADQQQYEPAFAALMPSTLPDPATTEKAPTAGFDWEGSLMFQPEDSDWKLSAGIRYGRSSKNSFLHKSAPIPTRTQEVFGGYFHKYCSVLHSYYCSHGRNAEFLDSHNGESEQHAILDFTLGKDVGIGMFGREGTGTVSAGVRVVQFKSQASSVLDSDAHYSFVPDILKVFKQIYDVIEQDEHSFKGIGPEVKWDDSQPVLGTPENGEVTVDWGVNAAVLFGRQSARRKSDTLYLLRYYSSYLSYLPPGHNPCHAAAGIGTCHTISSLKRSRRATVQNLGGYIGASVKYSNAKISFGYRADEFFGAMDGGEAVAKKYDRGFYGPYFNISLGFGG